MSTQVDSIPSVNNNYLYNVNTLGQNKQNNLLSSATLGNNYDDDLMLPSYLNLNNKTSFTSGAAGQTPTQYPVAASSDPIADQLRGALAEPINEGCNAVTENGNPYIKSSFWTKTAAVGGFLSPIVGKLGKLANGESFKSLFKVKQLAIACPALAVAGLAIGYLADKCTNSKRAKVADATAYNLQVQNLNTIV